VTGMNPDPLVPRRTSSEGLATHATRAVSAVFVVGLLLAGMWLLEVFAYLTDNRILTYGIQAHDVNDIPHVFTAPFLHANWDHLFANTVPFAILGFLAALRGLSKFLVMNVVVMVVGGLGVWFLAPEGSVTIGASILVFGYFGYLIGRGVFERRLFDIVIAVVVGGLFGTAILSGVLPNNPHISWQGHLFGLIGGVLASWTLRRRRAALTGH
jgi:membrane associated rhomboid family serine protease